MPDYYKVLSIDQTSSEAEIRKAYRNMAKRYHPDLNSDPDAKNMFILANEAYEILIDRRKRYSYDLRQGARSKMAPSYTKKYSDEPEAKYNEWVEKARERAKDHSKMPYEEFMKTSFYKRATLVSSIFYIGVVIIGIFVMCYPVYRWVYLADTQYLFGVMIVLIGGGFILTGSVGLDSNERGPLN